MIQRFCALEGLRLESSIIESVGHWIGLWRWTRREAWLVHRARCTSNLLAWASEKVVSTSCTMYGVSLGCMRNIAYDVFQSACLEERGLASTSCTMYLSLKGEPWRVHRARCTCVLLAFPCTMYCNPLGVSMNSRRVHRTRCACVLLAFFCMM